MPQVIINTDNFMKKSFLKRFVFSQKDVRLIKILNIIILITNLYSFFKNNILPFCQKGFNLKQ